MPKQKKPATKAVKNDSPPVEPESVEPENNDVVVDLEGESKTQNLDEAPPEPETKPEAKRGKGRKAICGCGWSGSENALTPDKNYPPDKGKIVGKVAYCPSCKSSRGFRFIA